MAWIYFPASEESVLHLNRGCELSAMSNLTVIASESCKPESGTGYLMTPPSGMTSEPLTVDPGLELWILSLGDSPARTCQLPENGKDSKTAIEAVYGQRCTDWFARYDPDSSLWRTCQGCLVLGLDEFLGNWPLAGMMRNGFVYRRQRLGHRTEENGSLFWPTPQVFDATCGDLKGKEYNGRTRHAMKLGNAVLRMYPTPTKADADVQRMSKGKNRPDEGGLLKAVRTWPTPSARDYKDGTYCPNVSVNGLLGRAVWPTPQARAGQDCPSERRCHTPNLEASVRATGEKTPQMTLNPDWVEWLMGYPIKWTDCDALVTL